MKKIKSNNFIFLLKKFLKRYLKKLIIKYRKNFNNNYFLNLIIVRNKIFFSKFLGV